MGWVQRAGIQEILLGGLIRPDSNAHAPDEFTTIDDVVGLARAVLLYLAADFAEDNPAAETSPPPDGASMIQFPTIGRRHFLAGTTALAGVSMPRIGLRAQPSAAARSR